MRVLAVVGFVVSVVCLWGVVLDGVGVRAGWFVGLLFGVVGAAVGAANVDGE